MVGVGGWTGLGPTPGSPRVQGNPCQLYVITCVGAQGCVCAPGTHHLGHQRVFPRTSWDW